MEYCSIQLVPLIVVDGLQDGAHDDNSFHISFELNLVKLGHVNT